jgi:hypothetical protein
LMHDWPVVSGDGTACGTSDSEYLFWAQLGFYRERLF